MWKLQRRFLSLLENEAKQLLAERGVNTQRFITLDTKTTTVELPPGEYVVKAQVAAGGRGKGNFPLVPKLKSGIMFTRDLQEAFKIAQAMQGQKLVTRQTGPAGETVQNVMVAQAVPDLLAEAYIAFILRGKKAILLASPRGGMDIESVPLEEIFELDVDSCNWLQTAALLFPFHSENHALMSKVANQLELLKDTFFRNDLLQLEINPFSIVANKNNNNNSKKNYNSELDVMCIDAKVEVDDNALFRGDCKDRHAINNYVKLENGNLGCVVNGAGLAMATMDIIKLHGGAPANFLDLGGKATPESIRDCVLQASNSVQGVFVNIFGGIVRCDDVATGLLMAKKILPEDLKIVVRLNGTNSSVAREMLRGEPGVYFEEDFDAAARLAVSLSSSECLEADGKGKNAIPCCH